MAMKFWADSIEAAMADAVDAVLTGVTILRDEDGDLISRDPETGDLEGVSGLSADISHDDTAPCWGASISLSRDYRMLIVFDARESDERRGELADFVNNLTPEQQAEGLVEMLAGAGIPGACDPREFLVDEAQRTGEPPRRRYHLHAGSDAADVAEAADLAYERFKLQRNSDCEYVEGGAEGFVPEMQRIVDRARERAAA